MNNRNRLKILIGALCVVLVCLLTVVALLLDSQSPDPILGVFHIEPTEAEEIPQPSTEAFHKIEIPGATEELPPPTEDERETEDRNHTEEKVDPPSEQPPSVDIPQTGGEDGLSFPCAIPGYDMTIAKIAPYDGIFVEDGSNANIENVAMLLVENNGDFPVEYTQIRVMCEGEEMLFDISALPAGEKMVVQEKTGKTIAGSKATSASALVVQRADMEMSENKVQVTDNGDNTLTIQNLTNETIPTVRVFYKYYMENEELFVGGIAFTARIARLGAGASVTIQPSHYTSQSSRVVMVSTYDSEV